MSERDAACDERRVVPRRRDFLAVGRYQPKVRRSTSPSIKVVNQVLNEVWVPAALNKASRQYDEFLADLERVREEAA